MLANLRALLGVFVDIVLLRRGPEAVPASPTLLVVLVALNLVLYSVAIEILLPIRPAAAPEPWLLYGVGFSLVLAWYRVAFHLARRPERFVQTAIAVFAVQLMALPALPLFATYATYLRAKPGDEPMPASLGLLVAIIVFWFLAIQVRIAKSAFEWPWAAAIVFVVSGNLCVFTLIGLIFGGTPKAT